MSTSDKTDVDSVVVHETPMEEDGSNVEQNEAQDDSLLNCAIITVLTPFDERIYLGPVSLIENGSFIRQNLTEFYETCSYTHYNIEYGSGAEAVAINDFVELANYLAPPSEGEEEEASASSSTSLEVTLRITLCNYEEKSAMTHVKRFRELVMFPPQAKAVVSEKEEEEKGDSKDSPETNSGDSGTTKLDDEALKAKKEQAKIKLPKAEVFLKEDITLKDFYDCVLYSVGQPGAQEGSMEEIILSDSILNVSYSGWNPPPYARSTAGDLCYFEVRTASNSVIHITATAAGFYVNNCTLNHFDPSPAPADKAHFSHELLYTLAGASASFNSQWESLGSKLEAVSAEKSARTVTNSPPNALQSIASLHQQGRGDFAFQTPQWHAQAPSSSSSSKQQRQLDTKHKYDPSRAQVVLADSFGMEEKGVPREWNEEIQSIRALPAKDTSEQIMKSRFIYRTTTEFTEACRQTVIAISKGHIAPVNPMDPEETQVYIYNNIFFSRSIDTKESFKVSSGDEASRKSTLQDFNNQKLLHALGIEGLSSVLCTVVDYMGQRVVGQSIIPGILQQVNENAARLMYGALEEGVRLKVSK
jgi:protein TIF31